VRLTMGDYKISNASKKDNRKEPPFRSIDYGPIWNVDDMINEWVFCLVYTTHNACAVS
jgi:hypothetical protein